MEQYIPLILAFVVLIALGVLKRVSIPTKQEKPKAIYQYTKKAFFMTRSEHEFFGMLIEATKNEYYVFAQVHLPTIVEHKVTGQNWKAAFTHINGKSVDFVLCDKAGTAPKLAIELDDSSHERADRQERDREVERILEAAHVPLLHISNYKSFTVEELAQKIQDSLAKK